MTVPDPKPDPLLTAAREWYDAGYCVIPSHEDGGKRPFGRWKDYQAQRPDWLEVEAWLSSGRYTGIGVLTGSASGNVEMAELEGPMDAAVERLGRAPDPEDSDYLQALEFETIKQTLIHLRSFPMVQILERRGYLHLHGAFFSVMDGRLLALDEASGQFEPIAEKAHAAAFLEARF